MIVLVQCQDQTGLVAAISSVLAGMGLSITSMREHVDSVQKRFFLRLSTETASDAKALHSALKAVLPSDAEITVNPNPDKKIILLVTKEYHCLSDILIRHHFGDLKAKIQCVIGNHDVLRNICDRFDIPFHFISHEQKTKDAFEAEVLQTIAKYSVDYLVLAKFMRILSPAFVARFPKRVINIHHSFLPAFIGASPYRQAYERGVKVIGATAHFVTDDLDEGPIVVQQTINVDHSFTTQDMIVAGKEIETAVLARALRLVLDDRILITGNKTVVFE